MFALKPQFFLRGYNAAVFYVFFHIVLDSFASSTGRPRNLNVKKNMDSKCAIVGNVVTGSLQIYRYWYEFLFSIWNDFSYSSVPRKKIHSPAGRYSVGYIPNSLYLFS